jgi:hypothetical protein
MSGQAKRVSSTGAVTTRTDPIRTEAALGRPESTGAAKYKDGPVTPTVAWLDEAETKVVASPERSRPRAADAQPETKDVDGS